MTPQLDDRLTVAMRRIGADYRPTETPARGDADEARGDADVVTARGHGGAATLSPSPRWHRTALLAAAAATVVGVAGVAVVSGPPTGPAARPASAPATVSAPDVEPVWGDGFEVPDVDAPQWAVRFDPSLGLGEFQLLNRYASWLYVTEPDAMRWFVHPTTTEPYVDAAIALSEYPSFVGDAPAGETWVSARRVHELTVSGEPEEAIVDAMRAEVESGVQLDQIAVPDGYVEITYRPFDSWQVTVPVVDLDQRRFAQGTTWSAGVIMPVDDTAHLALATAALQPGARQIADGWAVPSDTGWDLWFRDRAGRAIVRVRVEQNLAWEEVRALPGLVTVVSAVDLAEQPLITEWRPPGAAVEMVARQVPVTVGEFPGWGRWAALDATPDDAAPGVRCLAFVGVLAGAGGCSDATGRLLRCADLATATAQPGVDPVFLTNDRDVRPTWLSVEHDDATMAFHLAEQLEIGTAGGLLVVRGADRLRDDLRSEPVAITYGAGRVPAPVPDAPEAGDPEALCTLYWRSPGDDVSGTCADPDVLCHGVRATDGEYVAGQSKPVLWRGV